MFKSFLAAGAALSLALAATGAHALTTYTSKLEWRDVGGGPQLSNMPYGLVTIEELDAQTVKLTVTLSHAGSKFINTGGPHDPFLYNTTADYAVTILPPIDTFVDGGHGSFNATPFGTFSDKIACCNGKNGASKGDAPPLIFQVYNSAGITFAGVGATFDVDGKLLTTGTGSDAHFRSNAGGWWFAADIYDGASGLTYNVAAKDAFGPPPVPDCLTCNAVPEPSTWTMLIMGFGAVGWMVRRRYAIA